MTARFQMSPDEGHGRFVAKNLSQGDNFTPLENFVVESVNFLCDISCLIHCMFGLTRSKYS